MPSGFFLKKKTPCTAPASVRELENRSKVEDPARSNGGRLRDIWPACAPPRGRADSAQVLVCSSEYLQDNRAQTVCRMKVARRRASMLQLPKNARSPDR